MSKFNARNLNSNPQNQSSQHFQSRPGLESPNIIDNITYGRCDNCKSPVAILVNNQPVGFKDPI